MFPIAEELLARGHTGQRKDDILLPFLLPNLKNLFPNCKEHGLHVFGNYTANEGPVRIQYKRLVPINVFPEMKLCSLPKKNYNVRSPNSYTHISVTD